MKIQRTVFISHDITYEDRKIERKRQKRKENKKREEKWISPLTRKPKRVNKNEKISQKIWVD